MLLSAFDRAWCYPMDNASIILLSLDKHINHPVRLVIYGRAAIQLGFSDPPPETGNSQDVDVIVPLGDVDGLSADAEYWDTQEAANRELHSRGLYITHLFPADQLFLRRDWERYILPMTRPETRW